MNIFKSLHCIICLIKCSKYLYYIKKLLCCVTLAVSAVTVIGCFLGNDKKSECKKIISKFKAVM
ncbi:MAG: hypothetical protein NC215_10175 [Ruminococcus sp.]|nr:hypothetical protein [Ruminococcus sp.]MCM1393149.1 hypothetical protein [Ruminococcus sp.]